MPTALAIILSQIGDAVDGFAWIGREDPGLFSFRTRGPYHQHERAHCARILAGRLGLRVRHTLRITVSLTITSIETGEPSNVATLDGPVHLLSGLVAIDWVDDGTIFVSGADDGMLITIEREHRCTYVAKLSRTGTGRICPRRRASMHTSLIALLVSLLVFANTALAAQPSSATPVEVDGFPLSLSPDGSLLAGMGADGRQFCVWDIDRLESRCDGDLPDLVEVRSIAWSPDSTAVAFSLGVLNRLTDSDLYIFDAVTGTLGNLTEDDPDNTGADDIPFLDDPAQPVTIDYFPAWSPDGTSLVFARTVWGDDSVAPVILLTIPREGGEPQELAALTDASPLSLVGSMAWQEDGTIVFSTRHPNPLDEMNALWTLSADGELTRVLDGTGAAGIVEPAVADIAPDGRTVSAYSRLQLLENLGRPDAPIFFHLDMATGALTPWEDMPGVILSEGAVLMAAPVFSPDGSMTAFLIRNPAGHLTVSLLDANGELSEAGEVRYQTGSRPPLGTGRVTPQLHWAQDGTLLIVLATGGSILPLPVGTSTPIASRAT